MTGSFRPTVTLVVSLALGACGAVPDDSARDPLPVAELTAIDGAVIDLQALRGRPILLTFWSTTCASCLQEIPDLIELYRQLSGRGLKLIGIAMPHDRPDRVVQLKAQLGIPYALVFDPVGRVNEQFQTRQITPTHLLISPAGEIVLRHQGRLDLADLTDTILAML